MNSMNGSRLNNNNNNNVNNSNNSANGNAEGTIIIIDFHAEKKKSLLKKIKKQITKVLSLPQKEKPEKCPLDDFPKGHKPSAKASQNHTNGQVPSVFLKAQKEEKSHKEVEAMFKKKFVAVDSDADFLASKEAIPASEPKSDRDSKTQPMTSDEDSSEG